MNVYDCWEGVVEGWFLLYGIYAALVGKNKKLIFRYTIGKRGLYF